MPDAPLNPTHLPLAPLNFRDLGGMPTADGGTVRRAVLYRSAALGPGTDVDAIAATPVALVCDLRSPAERAAAPQQWSSDPPPAVMDVEMMSDEQAAGRAMARALLADESGRTSREYMFTTYRQMPERFARGGFAELVDRMLAPGGLPVLIHCHAGKDRTGFVCAVLLLALGVSREDVVADYLRSDAEFGLDRIFETVLGHAGHDAGLAVSAVGLEPMRVRGEYLLATFEEIDAQWGSLERYVARAAGLEGDRLQRLRGVLVEYD